MLRIAVTGAGGFIGSALVKRLAAGGMSSVVALTRVTPQNPVTNVTYATTGDLARCSTLESLLEGVDVVVHSAARVHIRRDEGRGALDLFRHVNVEGTLWLAKHAASVGIRRFVYISSVGIHGSATLPGRPFRSTDAPAPYDAYTQSKWEAEGALRALENICPMEVVVIRPPLVYGPSAPGNFGRLKNIIDRGVPLPFRSVRNMRSLVAMDNLLDLVARCVEHPAAAGQSFLVSDGEDLSTPEIIKRLAKAMHRPVRLIPVPMQLLRLAPRLTAPDRSVEALLESLQVDIQHTRNVLGWDPPISIDDAFKRTVGPTGLDQR